jgi:hypothetical protein
MKGTPMHRSPMPMELITDIVQQIGLDVVYEHEDLVFVSRNAFILEFTGQAHHVDLYFNEKIEEPKAQGLMAKIGKVGDAHGLQIECRGAFGFEENAQGLITLEFFDFAHHT